MNNMYYYFDDLILMILGLEFRIAFTSMIP